MDWLMVVLRFVHVVGGTLWVGMTTFTVVFLTPVIAEAGPEGGKVMATLQRRRGESFSPARPGAWAWS